ncbi:helix-turn-helix domain-containing protein [Streptomyces sp. M19]
MGVAVARASSGSRSDGTARPSVQGRPRDTSRDLAILDATLSLLTEVGYEQLSMEAVASRSGAAKTTIYRRYRDKAALVAAAVEHRSHAVPQSPPQVISEETSSGSSPGWPGRSPSRRSACSGAVRGDA